MAKAVAKKDEGAVLDPGAFEEYEGAGGETATSDDMSIPFITILQTNSPQVDEHEGAYIDGAKASMIVNSVTEDLFAGDPGIEIIPVLYKRSWTEWGADRGGFAASHPDESILKQTSKGGTNGTKDILPNGNEIVTSGDWYVMFRAAGTDDDWEQAVIAFASTQLKKSRRLMTQLKQLTFKRADGSTGQRPLFSSVVTLGTVPESNKHGKWFGWSVTDRSDLTDRALFGLAKDMYEGIKTGILKAAPPPSNAPAEGSNENEGDEEPPF